MVSNSELRLMRKEARQYLPDSCSIQTQTIVSDGMGGVTTTWANTYTNVRCKLSSTIRKGLENIGNQSQAMSDWTLTVKWDQAIATNNRVVTGGNTYEVINVDDVQSYRVARRAYLKRIE